MKKVSDCLAVLQAGGKGTRMRELTGDRLPKPLLRLGGRPMLEWQVRNLKKYGLTEFVIIVGHLGEQIEAELGDGSRLDVHIRYIAEQEPLGSGGALTYLRNELGDFRHVLVALGDVIFDIDLLRFVSFHETSGAAATLLVHPNAHPQDSDLVVLEHPEAKPDHPVTCALGGRVLHFDDKANVRDYYFENCVNAGLYLLEPEVVQGLGEARQMDLERDILLPYLEEGRLFGYRTTEYVKDAGTPARFRAAEADMYSGIWASKNLELPQKAVFLDRDGTLNTYRGLITSPDEIYLLPGAAEAVRLLNASKYLVIVVTNQPVVARGMCDIDDVLRINRCLSSILGKAGAYWDDIVFCPHHPHKGFPEENPLYKRVCNCRKPKTGMLDIMADRWHIALSKSWLIGDSSRDIECAKNAGMKSVLVHSGEHLRTDRMKPDYNALDILEAVKTILLEENKLEGRK